MPQTLELIPDEAQQAKPLFATEEEYEKFRQSFMDEVIPLQEKWLEARRKSEEEARQRLLR
jgi:hypothetical protein